MSMTINNYLSNVSYSRPGKIILYGILLMIVSASAMAQEKEKEKERGQGEIESVQYEIVVEKKIVLPPANRNFEKVAPRPAEPIKPEITYSFTNLDFRAADYNPTIRPLRLQNETLTKLYGNYISAGFGNFSSPYLAAYLTSKRDREKFVGASLYHRSFGKGPVDDSFSGSGESELRVFGSSFGKKATVSGFGAFENRGMYFYGYGDAKPAERSSIRQTYSTFSMGGDIKNSEVSDFNYKLATGFSYLNDNYKARESEVSAALASDFQLKRSGKIIVNADYFLIARKDELIDAKPRHLLRGTMGYRWSPLDEFQLMIGANIALENDTLGKDKSLHLYPNITASYDISKKLEAYANLTGNMDRVSLHTLARENNWVQSNIDIFHTNRLVEFQAGLRGSLGNKISFNTGASMATLKDLYFFQNDPTDAAKFNVYYDTDNTRLSNLFAELGVTHSTKLKLSLRGDVFSYTTAVTDRVGKGSPFVSAVSTERDVALHRPTFRVTSNFNYNLYDKILMNVSLVTQGGMKAIDFSQSSPTSLQVVDIKAAIDLNVGVDYLVSKQFSVFVKLNNVLANEYEVYLRYPVRGFQGLAGISWSF